jgi:hypothetical protein
MNKRGLNKQLQVKVKKFFAYIHKEEMQDNEEGS